MPEKIAEKVGAADPVIEFSLFEKKDHIADAAAAPKNKKATKKHIYYFMC